MDPLTGILIRLCSLQQTQTNPYWLQKSLLLSQDDVITNHYIDLCDNRTFSLFAKKKSF